MTPLRVLLLGLAATFLAQPAYSMSRAELDALVAQHAAANGVPVSLVHRVIIRESRYHPHLVGKGGAMGLMQIKTATARGVGYSGSSAGLLDPGTNLTYAVRYLAGAYRLAGGNHDRAVSYYAHGYYYAAKSRGQTVQTLAKAKAFGTQTLAESASGMTRRKSFRAHRHREGAVTARPSYEAAGREADALITHCWRPLAIQPILRVGQFQQCLLHREQALALAAAGVRVFGGRKALPRPAAQSGCRMHIDGHHGAFDQWRTAAAISRGTSGGVSARRPSRAARRCTLPQLGQNKFTGNC